MPELPEVETVRRGLAREVLDREIRRVVVTGNRSVRRHPPEVLDTLVGDRFATIDRFGKYLVLSTVGGNDLVIHLRMSGQLRIHDVGDPLVPHTHVRVDLGEEEMRFVDPRTFGELFISRGRDRSGRPIELDTLGPDALDGGIDIAVLGGMFAGRGVALKALLLDQRRIAGIGNIYGDEICFEARIRPSRPVGSISRAGTSRLVESIGGILSAAVTHGGSTLRDARYRGVRGEAGGFQDHHCVYGRAGAPCPRCGSAISGTKIAGRSAHYCPKCQR